MLGIIVFLIANIPSIKFFLPSSMLVNLGLMGVLFLCALSRCVVKNNFNLRLSFNIRLFLFLLLLFVSYAQASIFISFNFIDNYVFSQSMKYFYIVAVSAIILLFAQKQDMKIFVIFQAFWGVGIAVMSMANILKYSGEQHYNTVALPIGASLIILFSYAVFATPRIKGVLLASPFMTLLLLALFLLPGRGVLLFTSFAFFVIILIDVFHKSSFYSRVLKTSFYLMMGILFFSVYQNNRSPIQAHRMNRLFAQISTEPRIPLLSDTVYKTIDNPMGYGMGSSKRIVGYYPHNMFLESMLEFGILPTLVFFTIATVYPVRLLVLALRNEDRLLLSISALIFYLFLIFNTSYSLAHMYMYFSIISLALSHQNLVSSQTKRKKASTVWIPKAKFL